MDNLRRFAEDQTSDPNLQPPDLVRPTIQPAADDTKKQLGVFLEDQKEKFKRTEFGAKVDEQKSKLLQWGKDVKKKRTAAERKKAQQLARQAKKDAKKAKIAARREAKMAKKDIEAQIKKTGKINDGFICLPDPEDPFVWYYVIFGLDMKEYQGGFYFGKVVCPPEFPAKPPKVVLITENGRFHTWEEGICLSISSYHPESWNPVWKVNQIVIGLVSFWATEESTAGSWYRGELPFRSKHGETESDVRITYAKESREKVLKHEKFHIFKDYADAIGINNVPEIDTWKAH